MVSAILPRQTIPWARSQVLAARRRAGAMAVRRVQRFSDMKANLPLSGYRVLDMTRVLAGPYCTQMLGDLGAEVIKIEHPVRGDDTRAWGPPFAPYTPESGLRGPGESAYFLGVNRNKKSLALSFATPLGISLLHSLIPQFDILVENYLPGTLSRYQLDYPTLSKLNPDLIYASITGYGQTGPYNHRAGYDVMVEAEFGLMHITGERGGEPVKVGVAVTDLTTGLYAGNAIVSAVLGREKMRNEREREAWKKEKEGLLIRLAAAGKGTDSEKVGDVAQAEAGKGKGEVGMKKEKLGCHIDVSLSDCQTATLANIASSCLISGQPDTGRWGTAHPSIVPYRAFPTSAGSLLIGGGNDNLFNLITQVLSLPSLATNPLYATNALRVANRIALEAEITAVTKTKTTAEWLALFDRSGVPHAAVNDVKTTLEHAHTRERNMVVEMEHEGCGKIKVVNTPMKFTRFEDSEGVSSDGGESGGGIVTVGKARRPPPMLGQHTEEVLMGLLGMSSDEVQDLRREGVLR